MQTNEEMYLEQEDLRPWKGPPAPLAHNFYENIMAEHKANTDQRVASNTPRDARNQAVPQTSAQDGAVNSNTMKVVKELMDRSQKLIDRAAMKEAATTTLNADHPPFENLMPISFDQQELIRNIQNGRK